MGKTRITRELIFEGQSRRGGWSKAQIVELGIPWPLQSGWIDKAVGREVSNEQVYRFKELRDIHVQADATLDLFIEAKKHLRSI